MRLLISLLILVCSAGVLPAMQQQVTGVIESHPGKPRVAVPDFRGSGGAAPLMNTFNTTVLNDLQASPLINFVPKTLYPLQIPQQPSDLIPGVAPSTARTVTPQGSRLTDWSLPPVSTNFLGIGYGGENKGQLVVFGWFYSAAPTMPSI
ncbi:MAG TPA: hypothetical protein VGE93_24485, partial [Bryobacteraceae bacterium]